MKIRALGSGTSQGIPIIGCQCKVCLSSDSRDKRLRSSVYIESEKSKILIDIGPDFRHQFLSNNLHTVDYVLITHEHNDHIIGLDDIRAINFTQQKSVPFFAEDRVILQLKDRFSYAFQNKNPGVPKISLEAINETPFELGDIKITPLRIWHGRLPILGFKLNDFVYITDASKIENDTLEKIKECKVMIINALRKEDHYSHFTLKECLSVIEKVRPVQAYITHISHNMGLTSDWEKELPENVKPLNDKMEIII